MVNGVEHAIRARNCSGNIAETGSRNHLVINHRHQLFIWYQ